MDRSRRHAARATCSYDLSLRNRGASAVLTFRPSEFTELRWQYRRSQFACTRLANELLFRFLFFPVHVTCIRSSRTTDKE
jgi:hypothetical protein